MFALQIADKIDRGLLFLFKILHTTMTLRERKRMI